MQVPWYCDVSRGYKTLIWGCLKSGLQISEKQSPTFHSGWTILVTNKTFRLLWPTYSESETKQGLGFLGRRYCLRKTWDLPAIESALIALSPASLTDSNC